MAHTNLTQVGPVKLSGGIIEDTVKLWKAYWLVRWLNNQGKAIKKEDLSQYPKFNQDIYDYALEKEYLSEWEEVMQGTKVKVKGPRGTDFLEGQIVLLGFLREAWDLYGFITKLIALLITFITGFVLGVLGKFLFR